MQGYHSVTDGDLFRALDAMLSRVPVSADERAGLVGAVRGLIETGTGGAPFDPQGDYSHGPGLNPGLFRELGLDEQRKYFAVRDSELKLVGDTASVLAGMAAFLATGSLPAAPIATLFILLHRFRRKRIELTWQQGVVLAALREAPGTGWTPEQIAAKVGVATTLRLPDVNQILATLTSVRQADNAVVPLVRDDDGRWVAVDV